MATAKLYEQLGSALKTAQTGLINAQPAPTTPATTTTAKPTFAPATNPTVAPQVDLGTPTAPVTAATYNPEKYTATNAQATEWKVDSPQLVEDRIKGIVGENGVLMQQAETIGKQSAAKTGLLNSSMAVGAAQGAVLDKALPIAQQDANTMAAAGQFNAGAKNEMSRFNAGAANEAGQFNAATGNEAKQFNTEATNKTNQFNANLNEQGRQYDTGKLFEANMAAFDADNKIRLTEIDAQYRATIEGNKDAASLYNTYQQSINQILNSDMPDKQAALDLAFDSMRQGMGMYSDVDSLGLDAILAPSDTAGLDTYAVNSKLQKAQEQWDNTVASLNSNIPWESVRNSMIQQLGPRPA